MTLIINNKEIVACGTTITPSILEKIKEWLSAGPSSAMLHIATPGPEVSVFARLIKGNDVIEVFREVGKSYELRMKYCRYL